MRIDASSCKSTIRNEHPIHCCPSSLKDYERGIECYTKKHI